MNLVNIVFLTCVICSTQVQAQVDATAPSSSSSLASSSASSMSTSGSLVIVPAHGEVTHVNDEVVALFAIEEQDKDKAAAASRVNQKMKQGIEIVKAADPQAMLKTQGYYTYPVYPEAHPQQDGMLAKARVASSWRVGQTLQVTTTNLAALPKTVAAVQRLLTLGGLQFGLSPATTKKLDDQRIAATYQNLNVRMSSIAQAMGKTLGDAVLETVDFEGSGAYAPQGGVAAAPMMRSSVAEASQVEEPSFEPGETTLQMRLVGQVRFR
jgi:predicted secreted protein